MQLMSSSTELCWPSKQISCEWNTSLFWQYFICVQLCEPMWTHHGKLLRETWSHLGYCFSTIRKKSTRNALQTLSYTSGGRQTRHKLNEHPGALVGKTMQLQLPYELFHFPLRNCFCRYFDLNWVEKEEGRKFNQKAVNKLCSLKNYWTVPSLPALYTIYLCCRQIVLGWKINKKPPHYI